MKAQEALGPPSWLIHERRRPAPGASPRGRYARCCVSSSVVRLIVVMEMKMNMRLSIVCMRVDVNIRTIAKQEVEEARSQKDDHQRYDQFEEVCDVLGNRNAGSNHEGAGK